jgi:hypothetical protein
MRFIIISASITSDKDHRSAVLYKRKVTYAHSVSNAANGGRYLPFVRLVFGHFV